MVERLRAFYRDVIGLREGWRPPFRSQGHWLYAGDHDMLHLTVDATAHTTAPTLPARNGCFDHVAFACADLEAMPLRLHTAAVEYQREDVPVLGQVQLFLTDPVGVGVELNFSEEPGSGQNFPA